MKRNELVIVLHGLGRTPLSMWGVTNALRKQGYDVAAWGYPSIMGGMQDHITRLSKRFSGLSGYDKIHGVGHSLGGLMLRGVLSNTPHLPLGRIVMMGTPNNGASMITRHGWLFNKGPLNRQIIRDLEPGSAMLAALPIPPAEIGIIAGVEQFSPANPMSWINHRVFGATPHDGTVEVSSTKLPNMADFMEVKANHSFLPFNRQVIRATVGFINTGKFTP